MRIAVFSDTHDSYPPSLLGHLRTADEIWHLGDVCAPEVLAEFSALGPPLRVVRGNCDAEDRWPAELELVRAGVRFYLVHIPPEQAPSGCSAVLHGHTHVPRDELIDGVRWLNPGSASRPRSGGTRSFAWLTVAPGTLTSWELVQL